MGNRIKKTWVDNGLDLLQILPALWKWQTANPGEYIESAMLILHFASLRESTETSLSENLSFRRELQKKSRAGYLLWKQR